MERICRKADLVFFFVEKNIHDEPEFIIPNLEQEYLRSSELLEIIDEFDGDFDFRIYDERDISIYKNAHGLINNMWRVCRDYGEVHFVYERGDQQIAQYVKRNKNFVMAVMTDNSDFIVFETIEKIWWTGEVEFGEQKVLCLDRTRIIQHLRMTQRQLELLACLSGRSDSLPTSILEWQLYAPIYDEDTYENLFECLCSYVHGKLNENGEMCTIEEIAYDIFGPNYTKHQENSISNAIAHYDLDFKSRVDFANDQTMTFIKQRNSFIFKMMTDDIYVVADIGYIDLRYFKTKKFTTILMPILQRCFGILFAHMQKKRPKTRKICMKYKHNEPYIIKEEIIQYSSSTKTIHKNTQFFYNF